MAGRPGSLQLVTSDWRSRALPATRMPSPAELSMRLRTSVACEEALMETAASRESRKATS